VKEWPVLFFCESLVFGSFHIAALDN